MKKIGKRWLVLAVTVMVSILVSSSCPQPAEREARSFRPVGPGVSSPRRQAEVKMNLMDIFTKESGFHWDQGGYSDTFDKLGWAPAGQTRYSYFLPGQVIPALHGGPYQLPPDIQPEVSDTGFTVIAAGNIDNDPTLDVWSINDRKLLTNLVNDYDR